MTLPARAAELVELGRAAAWEVGITADAEGVSISLDDPETGDQIRASWRRTAAGGWRFYYGHDGWQPMTLTAIRSFLV